MNNCPGRPITERHLSAARKVLDIDSLGAEHFIRGHNGKSLRLGRLPTVSLDIESLKIDEVAIVSWRWDVNPDSHSSRNLYVVCQEARHQGVRYLLVDKVTINQELNDEDLLRERLTFSQLYQKVPVIAAYDQVTPDDIEPTADVHGSRVVLGNQLSRIMRRPWICYEAQLYGSNPTQVTYVGYIPGLGCSKDFSFCDMAKNIWGSTFCQTVLYTLEGSVGMHHVEDYRFILPRYFDLLSVAHSRMSKNDYLLATALLSGKDSDRVNNDHDIVRLMFDEFRIGEGYMPKELPRTQDYYTRHDIFLGNDVVGRWQTRHKFYPFEDLRVWFKVEGNAEDKIAEFLGKTGGSVNKQQTPLLTAARKILKILMPRLKLVFHNNDRL